MTKDNKLHLLNSLSGNETLLTAANVCCAGLMSMSKVTEIILGQVPHEEQGATYDRQQAIKNCQRYIIDLRTNYGVEPGQSSLLYKPTNHILDDGCMEYFHVVYKYDPTHPLEDEYAFKVEEGLPTWLKREKKGTKK